MVDLAEDRYLGIEGVDFVILPHRDTPTLDNSLAKSLDISHFSAAVQEVFLAWGHKGDSWRQELRDPNTGRWVESPHAATPDKIKWWENELAEAQRSGEATRIARAQARLKKLGADTPQTSTSQPKTPDQIWQDHIAAQKDLQYGGSQNAISLDGGGYTVTPGDVMTAKKWDVWRSDAPTSWSDGVVFHANPYTARERSSQYTKPKRYVMATRSTAIFRDREEAYQALFGKNMKDFTDWAVKQGNSTKQIDAMVDAKLARKLRARKHDSVLYTNPDGSGEPGSRELVLVEAHTNQLLRPKFVWHPEMDQFLDRKDWEGIVDVANPDDLQDPQVKQTLRDLSKATPYMKERLRSAGVKIYVGKGTAPELDEMSYLANWRPRGWGANQTWSDVPGLYSPSSGKVVVGTGRHGSDSVALHEVGHAMGDADRLDNSPSLIKHHKLLYHKLSRYLQQGGPGAEAGRQELLAESTATLLSRGRGTAVLAYDEDYVAWLESKLKKG